MNAIANTEFAASKFLASQCGKFARSKVSFYCALILDVAHNTGTAQKMPAGYVDAVAELSDTSAELAAKYCTVIGRALESKHSNEIMGSFAPTSDGVGRMVAWLTARLKDGDYTQSLEDIKLFFQDKASTKAKKAAAEQADKEAADRQRVADELRAKGEAERAAAGAATAVAKDAADKASMDDMRETNEALVNNIVRPAKAASGDIEHGTVVVGEYSAPVVITVTANNVGHVVNVPDDMSDDAIAAVLAYLQGMQSARQQLAEIAALEDATA